MDLGYRVEMGEAKGRKRKQVRDKTAGNCVLDTGCKTAAHRYT